MWSPVVRNSLVLKWAAKLSSAGNNSNTTQQNRSSTEEIKEYFNLKLEISTGFSRGKYKRKLDKYSNQNVLRMTGTINLLQNCLRGIVFFLK